MYPDQKPRRFFRRGFFLPKALDNDRKKGYNENEFFLKQTIIL